MSRDGDELPQGERDFLYEAQLAAENHLAKCSLAEEALDEAMAEGKGPDDWPTSPASAPFDSCDTCVVREVLSASWPYAVAEIAQFLENEGAPELAVQVLDKFRIAGQSEHLLDEAELMKEREDL